MTTLYSLIMSADSQREVDAIIDNHTLIIPDENREAICHFANSRKIHIVKLARQKKEAWKDQLN